MENHRMRIGVISDTHDCLPSSVVKALHGVDEVWHLGDVCAPSVLDELSVLGVPLHVVRGNCDWTTEWPLTMELSREGVVFHLVHIPPKEAPSGVDVLLHGHTHIPRDEVVHGVRFLNPGTVGKANKGAPPFFAFLEVTGGKVLSWEMVRVG